MEKSFIVAFVLVECMMLLSTLMIRSKITYNLGSQEEVRIFRKLISAFAIYLVSDILWALMIYGRLKSSYVCLCVLSITDLGCMGIVPYYWLVYVEEMLQPERRSQNPIMILGRILLGGYLILVVSSLKTGYLFVIDKEGVFLMGENTKPLIGVLLIYFIGVATLHGVIILIRNRKMRQRARMVVYFVFPIVIGLLAYVQHGTAIGVAPSVFTSLLMYFLSIEEQLIFEDNLTGLYNRKKLHVLGEEMQPTLTRSPIAIYYIDIDDFKTINDTYGHLAGNDALRVIGNALKTLGFEYNAVSARLGGDEFVVCVWKKSLPEKDFKDIIREEILAQAKAQNLPYTLQVSIGGVCCDDHAKPFTAYIDQADSAMYEEKQAKKEGRRD